MNSRATTEDYLYGGEQLSFCLGPGAGLNYMVFFCPARGRTDDDALKPGSNLQSNPVLLLVMVKNEERNWRMMSSFEAARMPAHV